MAPPKPVPQVGQWKKTVMQCKMVQEHLPLHPPPWLSPSLFSCPSNKSRRKQATDVHPSYSYLPLLLIWHWQSDRHRKPTAPHQDGDVDGGSALRAVRGVYKAVGSVKCSVGSTKYPMGSMKRPLGPTPCSVPCWWPPSSLPAPSSPTGADSYFPLLHVSGLSPVYGDGS